ncbi:MAG: Na(+)/H(+) antiporter subunit D [Sandaracinaceae bacterium]|nr:Na(+)/H(+) antiporter subunit D [Sandaracinaceae bacterium]
MSGALTQLFPGALLILGALFVPLFRGRAERFRNVYVLALPLLSAAHFALFSLGHQSTATLFGYTLELVRVDALSRVFGVIFHIAAFLCCLYAFHVKRPLEHVATLVYAGAAIGATFAGDLLTLFLFWELTALSSVFLILARGLDEPARRERVFRVAMRYLLIQVGSGVLLLAGTLIFYEATRSLHFGRMDLGETPGATLIFLAFGIKAAFPLLHNWMQDAYPEASVSGTVVLASFTTKLAIYALARGFAGTDILIPIGAAMTAFPIFFAVIENDLRRVLAYSLNNQLGYMVVGVGIGTELAINGAAAHAFAHILYKGLLLMSMGAVLYRTGTIKASELGGLHKSMPITTAFCVVGALAISAFPGLSGFVTKSMIITAVGDAHLLVIFGVLLFASAGVCDHSGIKIPFFTFFAHDQGWKVQEAPRHMLLAMGIAAALCIGIGVYPAALYALLPFPEAAARYDAYEATHVLTMLQLLFFAGLAFITLLKLRVYPAELPGTNLDTDYVYRVVLKRFVRESYALAGWVREGTWARVLRVRDRALGRLRLEHEPPRGRLGEPWTAGTTTLYAALVLFGLLLVTSTAGCGGDDSEANDARLLLDRVTALEGVPEQAFEARMERVEVLRALPLRGETLVTVRDACAEMYGALLEADIQNALIRTIGAPTEETSAADLQRLERAFTDAEAAAARVLAHRDGCVDGTASLRARYAPSRRGSE